MALQFPALQFPALQFPALQFPALQFMVMVGNHQPLFRFNNFRLRSSFVPLLHEKGRIDLILPTLALLMIWSVILRLLLMLVLPRQLFLPDRHLGGF